jgi:hypothetical protein
MSEDLATAPKLPPASIDFNALHKQCKSGAKAGTAPVKTKAVKAKVAKAHAAKARAAKSNAAKVPTQKV